MKASITIVVKVNDEGSPVEREVWAEYLFTIKDADLKQEILDGFDYLVTEEEKDKIIGQIFNLRNEKE